MNVTPRFVNLIKTYGTNIDSASVNVDLFTGATDGSRVEFLSISTTDTSTGSTVSLFVENTASVTFQIGTIAVALGSGTVSGIAPVDGINATELPFLPDDAHGNKMLNIQDGHKLTASIDAIGVAEKVVIVAGVRDYTE